MAWSVFLTWYLGIGLVVSAVVLWLIVRAERADHVANRALVRAWTQRDTVVAVLVFGPLLVLFLGAASVVWPALLVALLVPRYRAVLLT